jgi:hypothetical protein
MKYFSSFPLTQFQCITAYRLEKVCNLPQQFQSLYQRISLIKIFPFLGAITALIKYR